MRKQSILYAQSAPPQPADFSALLSCRCSASGSARAAPRRRNRVDGGPGLLGIQTSAIWPAVAGGCEMTLRVAIGGFGAIGKVVAERLDRGIEGLTLAAVSARDTVRAAAAMAGFAGPMRRLPLARLGDEVDVVVECAPAALLRELAEPALAQGCFVLV